MHGTAVPWEPQEMSGQIVQPFPEVLLCRHEITFVLFHRCQNTQVALYPAVVVVSDVILNHLYKLLAACKTLAIIPFSFENAPEAFHRAVINALGNSGHTLLHFCFLQFVIEYPVCVLESSVTVEQRMCIRICLNSSFQCIEYLRVIVAVADNKRNNSAVLQIKDGA